jgi:uncharacterized OB-fold protein
MAAQDERIVIANAVVPLDFTYNYRVGPYLERYIKGLGDKKIFGVKCSGCSKVVVPPRRICGACNRVMDEWVEIGPEGTVENYTVGHVTLNKGLVEKAKSPMVLALINLDGANSLLAGEVKGVEPSDVKSGMRVRAVFKDPAEDSLNDLDHFEPAS